MRKCLLVMLSLLIVTVGLCGCAQAFDDSEIRLHAAAMIDALIADDADAAYAVVADRVDRADFDANYEQMHSLLSSVDTYELTATGVSTRVTQELSAKTVTYRLAANDGAYTVQATMAMGYEGLYGFTVAPLSLSEAASVVGQHPVQLAFLTVALLETAFAVWMLVDCARHKVKNKVLWIMVILFGMLIFNFTVSDGGVQMGFNVGFILSFTSLKMYAGQAVGARILLPIGATVYAVLRKKLRLDEDLLLQPMPDILSKE